MAFNLFLVVPVLIGYTLGQSNFSYSQLITNLYADHEDRIWNLNDMAVLCFPRIFHCIEKNMARVEQQKSQLSTALINLLLGLRLFSSATYSSLGYWQLFGSLMLLAQLYTFSSALYKVKKNKRKPNCINFKK